VQNREGGEREETSPNGKRGGGKQSRTGNAAPEEVVGRKTRRRKTTSNGKRNGGKRVAAKKIRRDFFYFLRACREAGAREATFVAKKNWRNALGASSVYRIIERLKNLPILPNRR